MSDITAIDQSYHLDANIEVGKFTCLAPSATNYADGCNVPSGANGAFLGVAQESILPDAMADYSGGVYTLASGATWPTGAIPASGQGRNIRTRMFGISRIVAAAQISRGALVNIAAATTYGAVSNAQGLVKQVSESGVTINVVGVAIDAATQAGDVIRVLVMPYSYKG
ncbi:MAG: hypothetical protein ABSE93_09430 [Terriglobia bacterium]|jgi:hypothetical protein